MKFSKPGLFKHIFNDCSAYFWFRTSRSTEEKLYFPMNRPKLLLLYKLTGHWQLKMAQSQACRQWHLTGTYIAPLFLVSRYSVFVHKAYGPSRVTHVLPPWSHHKSMSYDLHSVRLYAECTKIAKSTVVHYFSSVKVIS